MTADPRGRGQAPGSHADGETEVELGVRPSRWWAVVAVVAVAGLLVAGALAVGGGDRRAADTTTSTSVPRSTSPTPDRATTAAAASTSTVPTRTTVDGAPFVEVASPPGVVLYGVSRELDRLWRIDLLTGDATTRGVRNLLALVSEGEAEVALLPRTGGVVLRAGDGPAVFLPDDPAAPAVVLEPTPTTTWVLPHADPSLLWRIDDSSRWLRAQPIDLRGAPAGDEVVVPVGRPLADDGTGRLLVSFAGGGYLLGADRSYVMLPAGQPVAVAADRIVQLECDDDEPLCDVVSRGRDRTEIGRASAAPPLWEGAPGFLSPSGRWLAVFDPDLGGLTTVDVGSGTSNQISQTDTGALVGPPWWVDDDLLCAGQADGHVVCTRTELGSFLLPDLAPSGFAAVAFARP